jgi:hypothetical protein
MVNFTLQPVYLLEKDPLVSIGYVHVKRRIVQKLDVKKDKREELM